MFGSDQLQIWIGLKTGDTSASMVTVGEEGRFEFRQIDGLVATGPTLTLPRDFAMTLMHALVSHFEGGGDVHQVRADLLHERARVDKMIDHILGMSRQALDKLPDGSEL